jgi:hypothetical protein
VTVRSPAVVPLGRGTRRARIAVVAVFFAHGVLFASWTAHIPRVKAQLGIDDSTLRAAGTS